MRLLRRKACDPFDRCYLLLSWSENDLSKVSTKHVEQYCSNLSCCVFSYLLNHFMWYLLSMACPANCAGHGVCDFSSDRPKCNCFDKTDPTPGCFQSFNYMPPKSDDMNQNSAFSWVTRHKDRGLRLSLLLLLGTVWLL
jgi:hypothetical protein